MSCGHVFAMHVVLRWASYWEVEIKVLAFVYQRMLSSVSHHKPTVVVHFLSQHGVTVFYLLMRIMPSVWQRNGITQFLRRNQAYQIRSCAFRYHGALLNASHVMTLMLLGVRWRFSTRCFDMIIDFLGGVDCLNPLYWFPDQLQHEPFLPYFFQVVIL